MFDQVLGSLFPADQAGVGLNSIIQLLINKLTVFIKLLTDKITKTIHFKLSPRRFPVGYMTKVFSSIVIPILENLTEILTMYKYN